MTKLEELKADLDAARKDLADATCAACIAAAASAYQDALKKQQETNND
jgi:hypothetical protein